MAVALVQQPIQNYAVEIGLDAAASLDEVIAVCPKCKTLETLWLSAGFLVPTRKFRQMGNKVYHDCGSIEPVCFYHF